MAVQKDFITPFQFTSFIYVLQQRSPVYDIIAIIDHKCMQLRWFKRLLIFKRQQRPLIQIFKEEVNAN